jgi:hypothetical protein
VSWEPELEELRRREELARRMGGEERVARQRASGRQTVRERIDALLDSGSFHETGGLAGKGEYGEDGELTGFLPANVIVGRAASTAAGPSSRRTTSRCAAAPRTRRSGRRWSGPSARRTTCACRWCAWSTAPAEAAA